MAYILLACSVIAEVFGTTMLKLSLGFTLLFPSLSVATGFLLSFLCLAYALKSIPLSIAYAIWSGLGTALTACVGIFLFDESISLLKSVALILVVGGVIILNKSQEQKETMQA